MLIKADKDTLDKILALPVGLRIRETFDRKTKKKKRTTVNSLKTLPDILFVLRKVYDLVPSEMADILHISAESYRRLESGEGIVSLRVYKYLVKHFELPEDLEKRIFSMVVFRSKNLEAYIHLKSHGKIYAFPQLYDNRKKFNAFLLFYRKLLMMSDYEVDSITEYLEGVRNAAE